MPLDYKTEIKLQRALRSRDDEALAEVAERAKRLGESFDDMKQAVEDAGYGRFIKRDTIALDNTVVSERSFRIHVDRYDDEDA